MIPELIALGTSIFGGVSAQNKAEEQNEANRRWQEHMRNTQYSATVGDMRRAGLNPMMLAHGGSLAQGMSPGGVQPETQLGEAISSSSAKAFAARVAMTQVEQMKAAANQANSAAKLSNEEADSVKQRRELEMLEWSGRAYTPGMEIKPSAIVPGGFKVLPDMDANKVGRVNMMEQLQRIASGRASVEEMRSNVGMREASEQLMIIQRRLAALGIPKEEAMSALYKKYGSEIAGARGWTEILGVLKMIVDLIK